MTKPKRWYFWAIESDLNSGKYKYFLGIGWFSQLVTPRTGGLDGPGTALFRTRKHARGAARNLRERGYHARPVRVVCEVRSAKP